MQIEQLNITYFLHTFYFHDHFRKQYVGETG